MDKEIDSDSYWQGCADSLQLFVDQIKQIEHMSGRYRTLLELMLIRAKTYRDKIREGKKYEPSK